MTQPTGAVGISQRPRPFFRRIIQSIAARNPEQRQSASIKVLRAIEVCHELLSERGEVLGVKLATEATVAVQEFDAVEQAAFFDLLAAEFSVDAAKLSATVDAYRIEPSEANLSRLQAAVTPPRQELFRRFNIAPAGTSVLVEMRHRLGSALADHPGWIGIDNDLLHLLKSWFSRGFLELRRIDWRTSAIVLERLIQYEAVHAIQGWRDLRRRLEKDRRCYGFFHPSLPDEPLIFVEVALACGMSATVQPLLDPDSAIVDPATADCAIFYSITNCQPGLRGVSFGNYLIKQVVDDLGKEFPRLRTFATLSPIPRFRAWLMSKTSEKFVSRELASWIVASEDGSAVAVNDLQGNLRTEITELCAYYLLHAKLGQAPLDPVARFHLANGARIERLNWMGDSSATGLQRSLGLTVNYLYRVKSLSRNHEAYALRYEVVASRRFVRLLRRLRRRRADEGRPVAGDK